MLPRDHAMAPSRWWLIYIDSASSAPVSAHEEALLETLAEDLAGALPSARQESGGWVSDSCDPVVLYPRKTGWGFRRWSEPGLFHPDPTQDPMTLAEVISLVRDVVARDLHGHSVEQAFMEYRAAHPVWVPAPWDARVPRLQPEAPDVPIGPPTYEEALHLGDDWADLVGTTITGFAALMQRSVEHESARWRASESIEAAIRESIVEALMRQRLASDAADAEGIARGLTARFWREAETPFVWRRDLEGFGGRAAAQGLEVIRTALGGSRIAKTFRGDRTARPSDIRMAGPIASVRATPYGAALLPRLAAGVAGLLATSPQWIDDQWSDREGRAGDILGDSIRRIVGRRIAPSRESASAEVALLLDAILDCLEDPGPAWGTPRLMGDVAGLRAASILQRWDRQFVAPTKGEELSL